MFSYIKEDFYRKSYHYYRKINIFDIIKLIFAEGSMTVILYRLSELFRDSRMKPLAYIISRLNGIFTGASIGYKAQLGPGLTIAHSNGIVINGAVVSGRNLAIDHQVTIGVGNGGIPEIGSYVFLGAGCKVLGAVKLGDYVRVGANAVVVSDAPDFSTIVGVPGKVVKVEPERVEMDRYQYPYKKMEMRHLKNRNNTDGKSSN